MSSPFVSKAVFLGFLAFALLLGGSGRADVVSLVILRPLAALAFAYGMIQLQGVRRTGFAFPIGAFVALAALAVVQLIPLPPGIWTSLPGREPLIAGHEAAQLALNWQPISVTPMATLNSLGAFIVPLAVLSLFAAADEETRLHAVMLICAFMLLSSAVAVLQSIAPGTSALYFYRSTNEASPVGLFANRNHQAVMLAATIPFILAIGERFGEERGPQFFWVGRFVALGLVALAVMTGSRAGSVLAIGAFAIVAPLFTYARLVARGKTRNLRKLKFTILAMPVVFLLIVAALFLLGGGAAFERLADKDGFGDLRFQILPEVFAMIAHSLPFGWGLGSFPDVYEIYERREMIQPSYINHAHNDWLEVMVEGGIIAPVIMLSLAVWTLRKAWQNKRQILSPRGDEGRIRFAALAALTILIAASLFDYPLRTPAGTAAFVLFLGMVAAPRSASQRKTNRGRAGR